MIVGRVPLNKLLCMDHMNKYISLIAFTFIVFLIVFYLPVNETMKGVYASPGVLGLLAILHQIIRDQTQHERMEYLQKQQQIFNIGSASHMANVTFDKHVEFCEKYLEVVHEAMNALWREGPTKKAVDFGNKLYTLRLSYSAWVTEDMGNELFPFEQGLRSLGAAQGFIDQTADSARHADDRSKVIWEVNSDIQKILGMKKGRNGEGEAEITIESVKRKVRNILGIEELANLRSSLIKEAINASKA